MSVDEILRAAEVLNVSAESFTDPFRLDGEGDFTWRFNDKEASDVQGLETRIGSWLAAFRELSKRLSSQPSLLHHSLRLGKEPSFEDVLVAGERFTVEFMPDLYPSKMLLHVVEMRLNYLVLNVDLGSNIAGAACRLSDLDVVIVNRHDTIEERIYTLAFELFHLLAWESIPPSQIESTERSSRTRTERLGDHFASAVLMPSHVLQRFGTWNDLSVDQRLNKLHSTADELGVTLQALKCRLVNVGLLNRQLAEAVPCRSLRIRDHQSEINETPPRFSKHFMQVIGDAIEHGHISVRRTSSLLDVTIEDLQDLFDAHTVKCEIGL